MEEILEKYCTYHHGIACYFYTGIMDVKFYKDENGVVYSCNLNYYFKSPEKLEMFFKSLQND